MEIVGERKKNSSTLWQKYMKKKKGIYRVISLFWSPQRQVVEDDYLWYMNKIVKKNIYIYHNIENM